LISDNVRTKPTMKIAVLTSGGDSAGMNAAVRSVVKAAILKCAVMRAST
jgi:6-phosphofructokinase 1